MPSALAPDGVTAGCRWLNPAPAAVDAGTATPSNNQWIPLSLAQNSAPLLAVSTNDRPSALAEFVWTGAFPFGLRRVLLTSGWYRGWGAGEWRSDVPGLIERNLIDPNWTATGGGSTSLGAVASGAMTGATSSAFVPMVALRFPLDESEQSVRQRALYGVPSTWALSPETPESVQWAGVGRVSEHVELDMTVICQLLPWSLPAVPRTTQAT